MPTVTITWSAGRGTVAPSSISVTGDDEVTWSAVGSDVLVKFPDRDVFGIDELEVEEDQSEILTVDKSAPTGSHVCDVHCEKDPGDGTPPVTMIVG